MKTKILITIFFFVWHIASTGFFGWNVMAESADEFIIDGIFLVGMAILWGKYPPQPR